MPIQKITSGVVDTSVFSSPTITSPIVSGNLSLDSTGTSGIRLPAANTLAFHTAGTEDVRIDSSGNVGVGVTSLSDKLTIAHADEKGITFKATGTDGTTAAQLFFEDTNGGTGGVFRFDHDVNSFTFATAGTTERMRIDSSGRVTKPYQPAFDAYGNAGGVTFTTEASIAFNSTTFNVGNHYNTSNYRFTAPVTGIYFFRAHVYKQSSGNASRLRLQKNAADVRFYTYISASDTYTHQITGIISLTAGDYVICTFGSDGAGTSIYLADNHSNFSGYLLG